MPKRHITGSERQQETRKMHIVESLSLSQSLQLKYIVFFFSVNFGHLNSKFLNRYCTWSKKNHADKK